MRRFLHNAWVGLLVLVSSVAFVLTAIAGWTHQTALTIEQLNRVSFVIRHSDPFIATGRSDPPKPGAAGNSDGERISPFDQGANFHFQKRAATAGAEPAALGVKRRIDSVRDFHCGDPLTAKYVPQDRPFKRE
jgi:hypothetical protein